MDIASSLLRTGRCLVVRISLDEVQMWYTITWSKRCIGRGPWSTGSYSVVESKLQCTQTQCEECTLRLTDAASMAFRPRGIEARILANSLDHENIHAFQSTVSE